MISGEDESERVDLDLNTEEIDQQNKYSLTDINKLPLFTNDFGFGEKIQMLEKIDLFVNEDKIKKEEENVEKDKLFEEAVVLQNSYESNESGLVNKVIFWLFVSVLFIGTFMLTRLYYIRRTGKDKK